MRRHAHPRGGHGHACRPRRHHDRRLFWRVYLHGIVLILLAGATALTTAWLSNAFPSWQRIEDRIGAFVVRELGPLAGDPAALERRLATWHEILEMDLAVYDRAGNRLVALGADPPAALDPPPAEGASVRRRSLRGYDLDGDRYVVARVLVPFAPGRGALVVGAVLLVLALASGPLARAITRPLERLTATARAFGQGDLSARTGLARRDEVGDLARAFDDMAGRIEGLVRSEKELLANVSHELRTPMARIRVALELCEEPDTGADQMRRHLGGIGNDLAELERLVSDVLTAARLDAGNGAFPLRRELVDLAAVVEQAAQRFLRDHASHELAAPASTARDPSATVDGDPVLLRRVLDNLLDNAAKFSEPSAGPIELALGVDGDEVWVEVRDRGIGVADEDIARLFDPFFRTDRSRDRGTGGVGLGLHLCRRIAEAHGGRIAAQGRDGGGLRVRLSLPAAGVPTSQGAERG
ncbi:MAG: HAMP domain-containing histidine kinase [Polyangiaceae bacterium]|nr:HAMP domain-containing histidine kinase [Polyangiaceae bacterium]